MIDVLDYTILDMKAKTEEALKSKLLSLGLEINPETMNRIDCIIQVGKPNKETYWIDKGTKKEIFLLSAEVIHSSNPVTLGEAEFQIKYEQ